MPSNNFSRSRSSHNGKWGNAFLFETTLTYGSPSCHRQHLSEEHQWLTFSNNNISSWLSQIRSPAALEPTGIASLCVLYIIWQSTIKPKRSRNAGQLIKAYYLQYCVILPAVRWGGGYFSNSGRQHTTTTFGRRKKEEEEEEEKFLEGGNGHGWERKGAIMPGRFYK